MMKPEILWYNENVDLPALDYAQVESWICSVASVHGYNTRNISYIFCDDNKILEVNKEFLQHDYFTDIITFDYTRGKNINGDIFISLDTVKSNAEQFGQSYDTELLRVIIHGILHLCGIDDKGPGEREIMEQNENDALEMFKTLNSK